MFETSLLQLWTCSLLQWFWRWDELGCNREIPTDWGSGKELSLDTACCNLYVSSSLVPNTRVYPIVIIPKNTSVCKTCTGDCICGL